VKAVRLHHYGESPVVEEVAAQASMAERIGATVVETPGSHAIHVPQAKLAADLIRTAAAAVSAVFAA
jgi:hypothetical protein